MDSLDERAICRMDMSDRCGDVILDARIGYDQGGVQDGRDTKSHFIEFLSTMIVFSFFCFVY